MPVAAVESVNSARPPTSAGFRKCSRCSRKYVATNPSQPSPTPAVRTREAPSLRDPQRSVARPPAASIALGSSTAARLPSVSEKNPCPRNQSRDSSPYQSVCGSTTPRSVISAKGRAPGAPFQRRRAALQSSPADAAATTRRHGDSSVSRPSVVRMMKPEASTSIGALSLKKRNQSSQK